MKEFEFSWNGVVALDEVLSKPFTRMSVSVTKLGSPISVVLWYSLDFGVRIVSKIFVVSDRREIGALDFILTSKPHADEKDVGNPFPSAEKFNVSKLTYIDLDVRAESGFILSTMDGHELVFVAGSIPCTLAIGGLHLGPRGFEPEYEISKYYSSEMR
jgi:hypothetical protein